MDLNTVMDEVGAQLGTIAGLRVYAFPADSVTPPAAIVGYPEIDYDLTYGRGGDSMTLPVWVVVGRQSDRKSRDNLAVYAAGAGASSIKQVVEAGSYTAFDVVVVAGATPDPVQVAAIDYFAYRFDLEITGTGAS